MSALGDVLRALSDVLSAQGVRWYVFGAQAVAVHGAPRATQDLDVTVEVERANVGSLLDTLNEAGFIHRFPALAEELARVGSVLPLLHEPTGFDVDLVIAGSGLEALALSRTTIRNLAGADVPIVSPTDLVVFKIVAGRARDLDDVRHVLLAGEVDLDDARDLLGQLEEALGQSDLVPCLDRALREIRRRQP